MSKTEEKVTKKKVASKKKVAGKKKVAKKKVVAKTAKKTTSRKKAAVSKPGTLISPRERYEMIATMAFYRAEQRNFAPGHDVEDWLECERIIDQMIAG